MSFDRQIRIIIPKLHFKNIRRFYGKIAASPFSVILQEPVNIFRDQTQYGSKGHGICFGHIALEPYKGIYLDFYKRSTSRRP